MNTLRNVCRLGQTEANRLATCPIPRRPQNPPILSIISPLDQSIYIWIFISQDSIKRWVVCGRDDETCRSNYSSRILFQAPSQIDIAIPQAVAVALLLYIFSTFFIQTMYGFVKDLLHHPARYDVDVRRCVEGHYCKAPPASWISRRFRVNLNRAGWYSRHFLLSIVSWDQN